MNPLRRSFHSDEAVFRLARSSIWRDALRCRRLHRGTSVQCEATARDAGAPQPIISGLFTIDRWDISRDVSSVEDRPETWTINRHRCAAVPSVGIDRSTRRTVLYLVENRGSRQPPYILWRSRSCAVGKGDFRQAANLSAGWLTTSCRSLSLCFSSLRRDTLIVGGAAGSCLVYVSGIDPVLRF